MYLVSCIRYYVTLHLKPNMKVIHTCWIKIGYPLLVASESSFSRHSNKNTTPILSQTYGIVVEKLSGKEPVSLGDTIMGLPFQQREHTFRRKGKLTIRITR